VTVNERLAELRAHNFNYLSNLPSVEEESVLIDSKKAKLAVWHDVLETGEHRIVVACYAPFWFGIGDKVRADGFAVNDRNEQRNLTDDELSSFR